MDGKILSYMNLNAAYQSKSIPKKNSFTFLSKVSGMPQIWTLDTSKNPVQYAEFDDTVINIHHSPNGDRSIVEKDNNGNEKHQFYLLLEGKGFEELLVSEEHFHNFGGWSPDGKYIAYSSNRRELGYFDIYIQNIETKESILIFEYNGNCNPITWLPDGENILINIPDNSLDQNIQKLNLATGKTIQISNKDTLARYQSFSLMKNEQKGYVLTDLFEETMYISKFSLDSPGEFEKIIHFGAWDIEELKLSSNEEMLAYTLNEGGIFKLYLLSLITDENIEIKNIPKGVIESISWMSNDKFIFSVTTPTCPGDIWQYTISTNKVDRLTYMSRFEEEPFPLFEPKLYTYKSFDGLEIPYFYYEKDSSVNKPTVLYVHGGPSVQTRAEYNYYIQYLVEQGFAVAAPNVRGSSGYGRTYLGLDDVRKRMDSVKDLVSLVDNLVEIHHVNPEKVGIMGRSYGGFMVLAAISHYPKLWAAAVDIVGISSFETFMENTGEWRRKLRGSEYGTLERDRDFFKTIDPINHSQKIKTPLLVFHGLNDSRVPVTEAIQIVMAMKERKQDVELTIFDDEGHFTQKKHNHISMNSQIVKFLEKKLKN